MIPRQRLFLNAGAVAAMSAPIPAGPPLGPEILINGDMGAAGGWELSSYGGAMPVISGGQLTMDNSGQAGYGSGAEQYYDPALVEGIYRLRYTIVSIAGATIEPYVGSAPATPRNAPGTYQEDVDSAGSISAFGFYINGDGIAVIDNASLKKVG